MNCTISLSSTTKSADACLLIKVLYVLRAFPGLLLVPAVKWIAKYLGILEHLVICTDNGLYIILGSIHLDIVSFSIIPNAFQVLLPTIPSAVRLFLTWNSLTAFSVFGPNSPSIVRFNACCRLFTALPLLPSFII